MAFLRPRLCAPSELLSSSHSVCNHRLGFGCGHGGRFDRPGGTDVYHPQPSVAENSIRVGETGLFGFASGIFSFSHELCRLVSWPKRPLCLHLGAEFFCYMDSPKELAQRLQNVELFLFGLKAAVSPATSPAARRVSSRHKHHTSSRVDYSDYESDSFLLRQSELYTPARSNPLSPTALSPTALSPKTLSPVGGDSGVSPLVKKTRRRPPNDGRVVSADHATGRVISADNTAERRRFRSISVGSIDETALPYPLDDPAPPTDPLNVLSKPRGD